MMRLRRQLPVYSPLAGGALLAGAAPGRNGHTALVELAELLRERYAAEHVILCGSGTQALQIAITGVEPHTQNPVLALPAYCCYDVATAAVGAGLQISLYDLDPDTLAPDLDSVERVLAAGAGAIVAAPLYGIPIPWEPLGTLTRAHGAVLVEDAAQGHGASWNDRPVGTLGSTSILSFGRGKGWTGGAGGAVLTRHGVAAPPPAWEYPAAMPLLGTLAQWVLGRPSLYGLPASIPWLGLGETRYKEPGPLTAMAPFCAKVLLSTRAAADEEAEARRKNATSLLEGLDDRGVSRIRVPAGGAAGYLRLPLRLRRGRGSPPVQRAAGRYGVAPGYPTTLAALAAVRERLTGPARAWPGADTLVRELVTLPVHSRMTAADLAAALRSTAS
jgi:perosamine synthetase